MPVEYKLIVGADGVKSIPLNEKGHPIIIKKEGDKDPEEVGLDALHLYRQVPTLQEEAKGHRKKSSARGEKLKILEDAGVLVNDDNFDLSDWVIKATGAVETVANLKDGDLVKAGEVETIKRQAEQNLTKKLEDATKSHVKTMEGLKGERDGLENQVYALMIGDQFNTSVFVKEKLNMTSKMARAYFRDSFKVVKQEDSSFKVVGFYPGNGDDPEKIYSVEKPGVLAEFEEALEILVDGDTDRTALLKGSDAQGAGAGGGGGGGGDFGALNPWLKDNWNLTKQGQLVKADPEKARRLAQQAGVTLKI